MKEKNSRTKAPWQLMLAYNAGLVRGLFKYLGVTQLGDADSLVPVNHRIANAWSRFWDPKGVLTDEKLPTRLRFRIVGFCVVSTFLYGCESWKLTEKSAQETECIMF